MKVGFDISQIAHYGGVATYTRELASQLVKLKGLDLRFFYSSMRKPYRGDLPNVKEVKIPPILLEILFNRVRILPIEKFIGQVDIFHSSDWMQPPTKGKKMTTYHDVIPLKYPEWSEKKIVEVHRRRLKIVEQEIDKVIAVSEATKQDLVAVSRIPAEKIVVIYEAAGEQFKPPTDEAVEKFKQKHDLPEKFVLAIGGRGNRRNLERVKEAVGDYPLIVTRQNLADISDIEIPLLYASAQALVYPSLYEGFGLPILEAMACGVPVITSHVGAMKEVAGGAALLVDPLAVEQISKAVRVVLDDVGLRQEKIKLGLKRSKDFSWQKTASQTLAVYKSLL